MAMEKHIRFISSEVAVLTWSHGASAIAIFKKGCLLFQILWYEEKNIFTYLHLLQAPGNQEEYLYYFIIKLDTGSTPHPRLLECHKWLHLVRLLY